VARNINRLTSAQKVLSVVSTTMAWRCTRNVRWIRISTLLRVPRTGSQGGSTKITDILLQLWP
jgi:hypothetical protein